MGEIIPDGGKVMIISGSADNTATVKRTKRIYGGIKLSLSINHDHGAKICI